MYEFLDSAVNILFLVCAAATFVTILAFSGSLPAGLSAAYSVPWVNRLFT